jgi:hypothetical protein
MDAPAGSAAMGHDTVESWRCVPLDWARTQTNLGTALVRLGERESGTERLEEAVTAFRAALQESTRERVPIDWAITQVGLGKVLGTLGERDGGRSRRWSGLIARRLRNSRALGCRSTLRIRRPIWAPRLPTLASESSLGT